MRVKLVTMTEVEAQLDKEVTDILGYAIDGKNL